MASPSVKMMGVAIQEGNYASSNVIPTRGMINRELGLTLLPGSQISSGQLDPTAHVTQVAFRDRRRGSHPEQALDLKCLSSRPNTSENDRPTTPISATEVGESAGANIQDVDLSSFQIPSIEDFSLDWWFGQAELPALQGSINAVAPVDLDTELFSGGFCAGSGSQQSHCLIEQSLESQQLGSEVSKTLTIEEVAKSDIAYSSPSWEALATGSPPISSDSLFIQGNLEHKPEPPVRHPFTTNSGLELHLHQLEQKIYDLTKSLQLTNKKLEDERAEKQKLKKKAKSLAKILRECAPGKIPVARMLKDVGKIPLDYEDHTRICYDSSLSPNTPSQVSPAPVEAQANQFTLPPSSPAPIDLTTGDEPLFITQISPFSSTPIPHTPSLRDHDLGPLATIYNRLEKRPLDWLEGPHPLIGAKRQKSLDFVNENIQAPEAANEARQTAKDARILRLKEKAQEKKLTSRLEQKAEREAKQSAEARGKKARNCQRPRAVQNRSEDFSMGKAGQMGKPTQGQVQDRTLHAPLPPDIFTLSSSKHNIPQSPSSNGDEDEDFTGLAAELEKAMEAEYGRRGEADDGLGAELDLAMAAEDAQKRNDADRLSAELEAAMLDEEETKKGGLGAELDATTMAAREGHGNYDDGPTTETNESAEESEEE